jgi:hypothetical protein
LISSAVAKPDLITGRALAIYFCQSKIKNQKYGIASQCSGES